MLGSPHDLLGHGFQAPSLPMVCSRLNEALNDPRSSTLEIAELIGNDAALTARLLRLVNSTFYGFPTRIETPSQAVMIIGTAHLCDLALTTAISRMFRDIPEDLVSMESFWRHSIACGLTARVLATHRREPNAERFFVAGVLHDIGRLVLFQQAPDLARAALLRAHERGELLHAAERDVVGFDHAAIGATLLRTWGLPASLEECVAYHHDPLQAHRHPLEAAIVHVADVITQALGFGTSGERLVPSVAPLAWDLLELPAAVVPIVVAEVEEQFGDVSRAILAEAVR
jgi:putative nucleotidyltransferase with HDIG domain